MLLSRSVRTLATAASTSTMRRLEGRVAIVTASTDGIGLAIARRLGQEGAKVVISSRKQQNVDKALAELRADGSNVEGLVCHVAKQEDRARLVQYTVQKHGGIDILVSNAAVNPVFGPMLECDEASWDKIFDINVKAAFLLTKECVPHMNKNKHGGSVVFVSSIGGYKAFEMLGPYSVSKTALFGLTKALSADLAQRNIRVNCLAPGIIKTKFSEMLWKNEAVADVAMTDIPVKRFGLPDEMAGAVAFMVSDDASYMTGEVMAVAGGMQSHL